MQKHIFLLLIYIYSIQNQVLSNESIELPNMAKISGINNDYTLDANSDGNCDTLVFDVGVNIYSPGQYSLISNLCTLNGEDISWSISSENFSSGYHIIHLMFEGKSIRRERLNCSYRLQNIQLVYGSSVASLKICDYIPIEYISSLYNYTDFAGDLINSSQKDKYISGHGYGCILLTVSIKKPLPVISGNYSNDIVNIHIPSISSTFNTSFPSNTRNLSEYAYDKEGTYTPSMLNNISVSASGVKNLKIGLKKQQSSYENPSNVWTDKHTIIKIYSQAPTNKYGVAKLETSLPSPGIYQAKIFGEATENVSQVNINMTLVEKIIVNGRFNLNINTTGYPSGHYSITAKALNGTFSLDELEIGDSTNT